MWTEVINFCLVRIMNRVLPDVSGTLFHPVWPQEILRNLYKYTILLHSQSVSRLKFPYEPHLLRDSQFTHPYNECPLYSVAQLIGGLRLVRLNTLFKVCRSRQNMNILSFPPPASTRSLCSR
jgi:hypothetical protein